MPADCRHGLVVDFCAYCRAAAQGLPRWVLVTGAGAVYHVRNDCDALHAGWARARRFGKEATALRRVDAVEARALGLEACSECCAHLYPHPPGTA